MSLFKTFPSAHLLLDQLILQINEAMIACITVACCSVALALQQELSAL